MITEQQLKADCTPELIKKMVELAEGFEFIEYDNPYTIILSAHSRWFVTDITKWVYGPLLIHRAVEGFNKRNSIVIYAKKNSVCLCDPSVYNDKYFWYDDYSNSILTKLECAMLHCLIEVLK